MNAALQNANGPAEAATSPDRGSIHPGKDKEMNSTKDNTGAASLPALSRRGFLGGMAVAAVPSVAAATSSTVKDLPTPEQRIAAAVQDIEEAMAERFPGFQISAKVEDQRPQIFGKGEGEIHRSMVMIYAHEDRYGPEEARWFVDYPDVRGAYR